MLAVPAGPTLSVAQARALDAWAAGTLGLPTLVLMENAAAGLETAVRERLAAAGAGLVRILCGPGQNGGDGLALARRLHGIGVPTEVVLSIAPSACRGDAAVQARVLRAAGISILDAPSRASARVVVDAVFGTGLTRPPSGRERELIDHGLEARRAGAWVIAADVPSGLDADRGEPFDPTVVANETITFGAAKTGLFASAAAGWVGRVRVVSLGLPAGGPAAPRVGGPTRCDGAP